MATAAEAAFPNRPAESVEQPVSPLMPLSLDTVLTVGDVKRILKIISIP
ncbi:MAG: hypothetical protein H7837_01705 [Magnetococcus sp. MYC-9]